MLPVGVKEPLEGSYSSALASEAAPELPPATSTRLTLVSKVAVCPARATVIAPVAKKPRRVRIAAALVMLRGTASVTTTSKTAPLSPRARSGVV